MTGPAVKRVNLDGTLEVSPVPAWIAGDLLPEFVFTDEDRAELDAIGATSSPTVFGGKGSGPRPGHKSPWYERGSKAKTKAGQRFRKSPARYTSWQATLKSPGVEAVVRDVAEALRDGLDAGQNAVRGGPDGSYTGDYALSAIYRAQGFDGLPTFVSEDEMNEIVMSRDGEAPPLDLGFDSIWPYKPVGSTSGWTHVPDTYLHKTADLYRGTIKTDPAFAETRAEEAKRGDWYAGLGTFGNGPYFAEDFESASNYATGPEAIVRASLDPSARVITDELVGEYGPMKRELRALVEGVEKVDGQLAPRTDEERYRVAQFLVLNDLGRWSAAEGYDALYVRTGVVVHNRTALAMQDGPVRPAKAEARYQRVEYPEGFARLKVVQETAKRLWGDRVRK